MKSPIRWMPIAAGVVLILSTALMSQSYEEMKKRNEEKLSGMRDQNEAMLQKLRDEVNGMRAEIQRKGLKFQVDITDQMKAKMSDIFSFKPPKPTPNPAPQPEPEPEPVTPPVPAEDPRSKCDPNAAAFDWRAHGALQPIRSQGSCGNCYLFAAIAAYEGAYKAQIRQSVALSEQYYMDCTNRFGCDGGFSPTVWAMMKTVGGQVADSYPYKMKKGACKVSTPSGNYKVAEFGLISEEKVAPVQAIKNALCAHGVLATAIRGTRMFAAYKSGIFNEGATGRINHAINIVGWDNSKRAWLIRNSYSTSWGEEGYAWVEWGSNSVGSWTAWVDPAH